MADKGVARTSKKCFEPFDAKRHMSEKMNETHIDKLSLYRGSTLEICRGVSLRAPTLSEICDHGESRYYGMVTTLCSVGVNWCWQLEERGIPFDQVSDYALFCQLLCRRYTSADTKILFGDHLDFSKMAPRIDKDGKILLAQKDGPAGEGAAIDERSYFAIVSCLREMHHLKRDGRVAGTPACRRAFIEDARAEHEARKLEPAKSTLLPLISTMVNMEGFKRDDESVWDMNVYAFMDSVRRISKIRNSNLLLQSGYSGFGLDLKKLNKEELDYMGELD